MDYNQIDTMLKELAVKEYKNTDEITTNLDIKISETLTNLHTLKVYKYNRLKIAACLLLCTFIFCSFFPQKTLASIEAMFTYVVKGKDHLIGENSFIFIRRTITANDVNVSVDKVATDNNTIIIVYQINSPKFNFSKGVAFSNDNTNLSVLIDGIEAKPSSDTVSLEISNKNTLKFTQSIEYPSLPTNCKVDFNFNKILNITGNWHFNFLLNKSSNQSD